MNGLVAKQIMSKSSDEAIPKQTFLDFFGKGSPRRDC